MEEEVKIKFFLPALLLVTGLCFLAFDLALWILDGVNMTFFLWFGLITFMTGLLTGVFTMFEKRQNSVQNSEP